MTDWVLFILKMTALIHLIHFHIYVHCCHLSKHIKTTEKNTTMPTLQRRFLCSQHWSIYHTVFGVSIWPHDQGLQSRTSFSNPRNRNWGFCHPVIELRLRDLVDKIGFVTVKHVFNPSVTGPGEQLEQRWSRWQPPSIFDWVSRACSRVWMWWLNYAGNDVLRTLTVSTAIL